MQSKSIQITLALIVALVSFLFGFYVHLPYQNLASQKQNQTTKKTTLPISSFQPPLPLSDPAITSAHIIYVIDGTIKDLNETRTMLSLATREGKPLGDFKLPSDAIIFTSSNGATIRTDKKALNKGQKATVNLRYDFSSGTVSSTYISNIVIK